MRCWSMMSDSSCVPNIFNGSATWSILGPPKYDKKKTTHPLEWIDDLRRWEGPILISHVFEIFEYLEWHGNNLNVTCFHWMVANVSSCWSVKLWAPDAKDLLQAEKNGNHWNGLCALDSWYIESEMDLPFVHCKERSGYGHWMAKARAAICEHGDGLTNDYYLNCTLA